MMQNKKWEHKEIEFNSEELNLIDCMLKDSLKEDFHVNIPMNFADNIVEKIEKRRSIREALLKHLMMCIGLLVIIAFAIAFLFYFELKQADILVQYAFQFKYPIAFVLFTITTIQLADSFLLSRTKDQLNR